MKNLGAIIGPYIPKSFNRYIVDLCRQEMSPRKVAMERLFEFVQYNQIKGDYLEFGVAGAHTFRLAYDRIVLIGREDIHMYGFDSFQGLPEPKGVDEHPNFSAGDFCHSRVSVEGKLRSHGIPERRYTLIEGFYNDTLNEELRNQLAIQAAAVIWIDCDLYESAKDVLDFVKPYIQTGTLIVFDDFYCFNGDPERGEQKAWREFLQRNKDVDAIDYFNFTWAGKVVIAKKK